MGDGALSLWTLRLLRQRAARRRAAADPADPRPGTGPGGADQNPLAGAGAAGACGTALVPASFVTSEELRCRTPAQAAVGAWDVVVFATHNRTAGEAGDAVATAEKVEVMLKGEGAGGLLSAEALLQLKRDVRVGEPAESK